MEPIFLQSPQALNEFFDFLCTAFFPNPIINVEKETGTI